MQYQNEVEQVELALADAKEMIERKRMVLSLEGNRAFKKIILEGYFEKEAARLALLSSDPMLNNDQRGSVFQDLAGLGALQRYLRTIIMMGTMAEQSVEEYQDTLDDLRAEGADEDMGDNE